MVLGVKPMEITCNKCGSTITVKGLGRKRTAINFNIVSKAFQLNEKGKPALTKMALAINREKGVNISPALVLLRLREEASKRGITFDELIAQIMTKGKRRKG
jgi:hypothetical protein